MNGATSLPGASALGSAIPTPAVQPPPIAERFRRKLMTVGEAIRGRFALATSAFHDRLAWERTSDTLPPSPRLGPERRLAGYLFPLGGGAPMPLYEGSCDAWRVEGDFLQLLGVEDAMTRYHTNERLRIGTENFLLKLLDEPSRIIVQEVTP